MDTETRKMIDEWLDRNGYKPKSKPTKKPNIFDDLITVYSYGSVEKVL